MGLRRRSREIALQVLFQSEFEPKLTAEQALHLFLDNFETNPDTSDYATELVQGILIKKPELDSLIEAHSQNWSVGRMAFVDRNILRIATFELKFLSASVPYKVVIDEAIEIGKKFGSQDSSSFINGILDNILKTLPQ
jgi:N utilization substance protein B